METKITRKYVRKPGSNSPGAPIKYTIEFIEGEADALIDYINQADLPLVQEFAGLRGYVSQRFPEFAKVSVKFSESLAKLHDKQHIVLIKGGLSSKYNAAITALMLKNNFGYREKHEIETRQEITIKVIHEEIEERLICLN